MNTKSINQRSDSKLSKELVIADAKSELISSVNKWFADLSSHVNQVPTGFNEQIQLLSTIRSSMYEELNQLQHVALIIKVAESLSNEFPKIDKWLWHPKQTSDPEYADLTGLKNGEVFLNAEVTTSLKPVGTIDIRMKSTMLSLNEKKGLRFYYVQSEAMLKRARKKKEDLKLMIDIRLI